jgi:GH24 family phage-related lysozyme (muramidase)
LKPTLAELAAALIAAFEGPERLQAFKDGGGIWTIGRGHTLDVHEGMTITPEQSAAFFSEDSARLLKLAQFAPPIAGAAYVSFGYNCGYTALLRVLNGIDTIGDRRHTTDRTGNVEAGLVNRRRLEKLLIDASA